MRHPNVGNTFFIVSEFSTSLTALSSTLKKNNGIREQKDNRNRIHHKQITKFIICE